MSVAEPVCSQRAHPKEPPSPLVGEGLGVRGVLSFHANLLWPGNRCAPLIRLFADAKTHLLPQGEKGSVGQSREKGHTQ